MLQKRYFDYGFGITNYFKYFVYMFTAYEIIGKQSITSSIMILVAWGVFCYFFGRYLYNYGWHAAEQEILNRINPFVQGVRKNLKIRDT